MVQIHIPEIKASILMEKIRDGARRGGGWASPHTVAESAPTVSGSGMSVNASTGASPTPFSVPPLVLQPEFQTHHNDQYHVNDLLRFHDRDFIQNAYRAILKRYPDAHGFEQFLEKLRSGQLNKVDILARLRFSPEGHAKNVQVKGLLLPSIVRRAYNVPLFGYLVRLLVGLARVPHMIRYQQQLEGYLLAQQQLVSDYANDRGRELAAALNQVSALEQTLIKQRDELSRQIDRLADEQKALQAETRASFDESLSELNARVEARSRLESRERREEIELSAQKLRLALEQESAKLREEARAEASELQKEIGQESKRLSSGAQETRRELSERLEQLSQSLSQQVEDVTLGLNEQTQQAERRQQEIRTEIIAQARRITLLLEEARRALPAPFTQGQLQKMADERERGLDAFYLSFENLFRGSHTDIKNRFRVYLPVLKRKGVGASAMPVLDIGCGRGEWLELLGEEGLLARGVEANRVEVAQCRERGLEVVEADFISYLRELPERSVGAVTGFHVIEHLPAAMMIEVLDEAVRVLKSGGVLIFETPNPQNVLVGSYYFHFDPTHQKPLPSPVMSFLFEARGLVEVEIINLHPAETQRVEGDSDLVKRFNDYFYGPMDYAVVGWKA
jgi:O-antigen chain-terminating methyltransferase